MSDSETHLDQVVWQLSYLQKLEYEQRSLQDELKKLAQSKKHQKRLKSFRKRGIDVSAFYMNENLIQEYNSYQPTTKPDNSKALNFLCSFKLIRWILGFFTFLIKCYYNYRFQKNLLKAKRALEREWYISSIGVKESRIEYLQSVRSEFRHKYRALINRIKKKCPDDSTKTDESIPLKEKFYHFIDRISSRTKLISSDLTSNILLVRSNNLNYVQRNIKFYIKRPSISFKN